MPAGTDTTPRPISSIRKVKILPLVDATLMVTSGEVPMTHRFSRNNTSMRSFS